MKKAMDSDKPETSKRKKTAVKLNIVQPRHWNEIDPNDLSNPALFINRELGWLEFNQRVLNQARDPRHPLLERVKFLSIVGTNLDEFFMIRVATILKKYRAQVEDVSPDGLSTQQQLWAIRERVQKMLDDQEECWSDMLRPLLAQEQIYFLEPGDYNSDIDSFLSDYFMKEVYPVLTPLAFDPGHPFPHISNLSMNFAVVVKHDQEVKFARVKIPSMLPRFVELPEKVAGRKGNTFVFLEDIIRKNMAFLFPEVAIEGTYLFRVIRDTDIVIQEDEADDLLESVDRSLKQMRYGAISLLEVENEMPIRIINILAENFEVDEDVILKTDRRMSFDDWKEITKIHRPQLKDTPFSPKLIFNTTEEGQSIFDQIRYQDYLVHHPYESFSNVETFLKAAVSDPHVIAIKMTLYRIGENSPIVRELIRAAEAGKQVAVLVELKARFDERNNIVWANQLEAVGVHVVYGLVNLKTHSKLCLIVRKESDGIRRYVHLGTGNYNRATSQGYTDLGLFTSNTEITEDVSEVFNYLTGYSNKKTYQRLLVAPLSLRQGLKSLIERETKIALTGRSARIIIKNNSITDPELMRELFKASQAGVKIDLIVRGVCCLRPGIPGISDNIRVISIVGRFLEHSRIYYFQNDGNEEIFVGSADLMERNLDRRVEVLFPILVDHIKDHVRNVILENMLRDTDRAMQLRTDGEYETLAKVEEMPLFNSQQFLLECYTGKK